MALLSSSVVQAQESSPDSLIFRRQGVQRMLFDRSQSVPLSSLNPKTILGLDVMHPEIGKASKRPRTTLEGGSLQIAGSEPCSSTRWVGGFNPFATYELMLQTFEGTGQIGIRFQHSEEATHLTASIEVKENKYQSIRWEVVRQGESLEQSSFPWPTDIPTSEPVRLRVQMLAVGVNLFIESAGELRLVGYPDFGQHLELRKVSELQRYEVGLHSELTTPSSIQVEEVTGALTPGCGQADIRAITTRDGRPLIEDGRLWITMTIRGRALPHPMQGVFSMSPTVFDLRFEGIIVFDSGDGLWRNELASHLFYDDLAGQWRGWTTGFSALAEHATQEKAILAVSSDRDPRKGFSVMKARPIGLVGQHEDPHGLYDEQAKKWRLLIAERAGKYRAGIWESDDWDRGFERLAGPVPMDSTGTLIQAIGNQRYVFFGSADRKVYIHSYPDLKPAGELNMYLPPWNDETNTRIWPNIIPLPDGYPVPYIALMMDRVNFPDMPKANWTYGAMYLYHGVLSDQGVPKLDTSLKP